ncbi:hypothetical protein [Chroococcidiopsis cubana]|uniref:hypothetical protein n=1 Tax=Chroococcidiopsis cubana TaxID=171392 RepID=UPI000F8CD9A0|nr:hypothetical protein [Chroococcidiopsis cubana]
MYSSHPHSCRQVTDRSRVFVKRLLKVWRSHLTSTSASSAPILYLQSPADLQPLPEESFVIGHSSLVICYIDYKKSALGD